MKPPGLPRTSVGGMSSRIGELLHVGCSARIAARWQRSNSYDLTWRAEARYRRCFQGRRRPGSSWSGVVGGRQVHGRTNDLAGCGTATTGWGARIGVLWLSAAPAQAAGNETSGPPCEGYGADAVPAGNAGYACRSQFVASGLRKVRIASDVARH